MKKNAKKIILAVLLAFVLIVPATVIPIWASNATTTYLLTEDFESATLNQAVAKNANSISSAQRVPATAKFVADPDGSGKAIKMDLTVMNLTNEALGREEAAYGTINSSQDGTNIDRNLTVNNPQLACTSNQKVVMEIDYYIPAGSNGIVESQIIGYLYNSTTYYDDITEDRNGDKKLDGANPGYGKPASWFSLYTIDTGTATLKAYGSTAQMKFDTWHTVSLVFNMTAGTFDLYLDNVKKLECDTGKTNLTFNAGQWNVAKIMKAYDTVNGTRVGAPDYYKGSFYVDNPRIHTDTTVKTGNAIAGGSDPVLYVDVIGATGNKALAGPGDTILMTAKASNGKFSAVAAAPGMLLTADMTDGLVSSPDEYASVRLSNPSGLRFRTELDTNKLADLQALVAAGKIKAVNIGTLITPWSRVTEAGAFTVEALNQLDYDANYLDVKATVGEYYKDADANGIATFVGSIVSIREQNLTRDFAAVGYVKLTLIDGSFVYVYSWQYNASNASNLKAEYAHNIDAEATELLSDPAYSQYETVLEDMTKTDALAIDTTAVYNVLQKNTKLFFTLKNGSGADIYCRLTYDGANGWRLQANDKSYNSFNDIGAAQALSLYMDETYDDVAEVLNVQINTNSKIMTVTSADASSKAVISYGNSFNVDFVNIASGKTLYNVNSITQSNGKIVMSGKLDANEAVYGGGERFDAANKRGQSMQLFSYDAYNVKYVESTGAMPGTYVVIPLFSTSRGGGMFINRYEVMDVTFGAVGNTAWSVTIDNNLIDTYFYATGKISDVLKSYTDLSGHAALPEEWAQGVLICRYSPDLTSMEGVDGDPNGMSLTYATPADVPNYKTYSLSSNGAAIGDSSHTWKNGEFLYNGNRRIYRYVVEDDTDFNENGKLDSYFIRIHNSGGPVGAGVKYIVESLEAAGMKPTAMVLEGWSWANATTNAASYAEMKEVCDYLAAKNIKTTVYMAVGSLNYSAMAGYKPEYSTWITVYKDEAHTNAIGRTREIPKNGTADNPDAVGAETQNYLDITNPEAVEWYINTIWKPIVELGVLGCKIDFCELMPDEDYYSNMTIDGTKMSGYVDYDWYDDTVFEGSDIHHAYSTYFISLFYREMSEMSKQCGKEGFVVLSRGGGIGSQRNPYIWAGDQQRLFGNMRTQFMATINSGLSGIPFLTYDMAGYNYAEANIWFGENQTTNGSLYSRDWIYNGTKAQTIYVKLDNLKEAMNYESEIFVRSIQYSAFSTMIQTHGCVRHMYDLNEDAQQISAYYSQLHEDLTPYLQKMSQIACDTGMPVMRHMVLQYQDDANVANLETQYMFGEALLVAPILEASLTKGSKYNGNYYAYDHNYAQDMTRTVYLPAGEWVDLRTGETIISTGETITTTAAFHEIPVYLDANSKYASELRQVFAGDAWGNLMGDFSESDIFDD